MNNEQIIQMARDFGIFVGDQLGTVVTGKSKIVSLVQAVRAATKEEDAKICEERAAYTWDEISDACDTPQEMTDLECHECAAAIRASK